MTMRTRRRQREQRRTVSRVWRRAVAAALLLQPVAIGPYWSGETNECSLQSQTCTCDGADSARCEQLTPLFESSTRRCRDFEEDSVVCTQDSNSGYCLWKGRMQPDSSLVTGTCVTDVCWLKFQHTLAACPGYWPNMTTVGPDAVFTPSRSACDPECASHFVAFYRDRRCMNWLEDMMLCDRQLMRPAFTSDCVAKPSMRDDLEAYAKLCAVEYENEELGDLFTTVVVLGSLCALFGCFCTKKQRAWEKIEEEERREVAEELGRGDVEVGGPTKVEQQRAAAKAMQRARELGIVRQEVNEAAAEALQREAAAKAAQREAAAQKKEKKEKKEKKKTGKQKAKGAGAVALPKDLPRVESPVSFENPLDGPVASLNIARSSGFDDELTEPQLLSAGAGFDDEYQPPSSSARASKREASGWNFDEEDAYAYTPNPDGDE